MVWTCQFIHQDICEQFYTSIKYSYTLSMHDLNFIKSIIFRYFYKIKKIEIMKKNHTQKMETASPSLLWKLLRNPNCCLKATQALGIT